MEFRFTKPQSNYSVNEARKGREKKEKGEKKIESTSSVEAVSTHRLLRRPDFFFFLFFGRGDGELLDFLFTLNWPLGGGGGESEIESEEGRNNLQVIVSAIILPKNKFLIIVICCFADKKAISVYFLISPHLLCHNAKYSCNISYNGNKKLLRGNCV